MINSSKGWRKSLDKSVAARGPLPVWRLLAWLVDRADGLRGPPLNRDEQNLLWSCRYATRGTGDAPPY